MDNCCIILFMLIIFFLFMTIIITFIQKKWITIEYESNQNNELLEQIEILSEEISEDNKNTKTEEIEIL